MGLSNALKKMMQHATRFGALASELWKAIDSQFGRNVLVKAANYTLTAADNGATVLCTAAADITLPAAAAGLSYYVAQTADANLAILAPGSNDSIITKNDTGADSVTFSTAGQKIGSAVLVTAVTLDSGATYKWFLANIGGTTATIA